MSRVWCCLSGDVDAKHLPSEANETMEAIVYAQYLRLIGDLPDAVRSTWVPVEGGRVAWAVMLGYAPDDRVPFGGDAPMRNAVALAWRAIEPPGAYGYMRSGWFEEDSPRLISDAQSWFGNRSAFA